MTGLLSAVEIAEGVTRGRFGCADVVAHCLSRAERAEPKIRAFAQLDPRSIRDAAHACDSDISRLRTGKHDLPLLAGVPVAVKDIIDTARIPTECGADLFVGRVPEHDASLIQNLKWAGALIFGKTVTAECAFFHPGPTRNPWDLSRTPGGSSMGSAAAVAAGIVPLAVGTQTNGSVIRPAAFCGVIGFKPSSGRISTDGVLRFSGTLDTIGGFARSVEDVAYLCATLARDPLSDWWDGSSFGPEARREGVAGMRLAIARTAEWSSADPSMRARFEADVAALARAGAVLQEVPLPDDLDEVALTTHRTIMQREAADNLGPLIAQQPDRVSRILREYVEAGASIERATYERALQTRARLIDSFRAWSSVYDAILTPPALGEAPGPETTGDPRFCTRWTLVGAPALAMPTGLGPHSLPLGLQLVGTPGDDRRLLHIAAAIHRTVGANLGFPIYDEA